MRTITAFILTIALSGCEMETPQTKIGFDVKSVGFDTFFLEKVEFGSQGTIKIDSVQKRKFRDTLHFSLLQKDHGLYQIRSSASAMRILFINDAVEIFIKADYFKKDYDLYGSPESFSLKKFLDEQKQLHDQAARLTEIIKLNELTSVANDSPIDDLQQIQRTTRSRYLGFADTVSNPSLCLYVSDFVDFGKNFAELRKFTERNALRFPDFRPLQDHKREVFDYLMLFEEDLELGDSLPKLTLLDVKGNEFTLRNSRKVLLIDFWSTWCGPCRQFDRVKQMAFQKFPPSEFAMVSVALDPSLEIGQSFIEQKGWSWPQLIDSKVWHGQAAKAFKLDTLPANFLFSRKGQLLKKNIPPELMEQEIATAIENR